MASLPSPPALSAPTLPPAALNPPTLLIRAPTFRESDRAATPEAQAVQIRPSTPQGAPGSHSPSNSQLRQPSPTPSNASRYSIDIPTYDDYEHIPQLPSPPRALSPYRDARGQAHSRSASVPHNDYLDPDFLDITTIPGRSRAQTHQRSRTELLPAFVSQTLQRTLSRSPAQGNVRGSPAQARSPSPEKLSHSRSTSPEKRSERPGSALSVRGGGLTDLGGLLGREEMLLTGEGRVSAAARRRAAASGASMASVDSEATPTAPTPASPAPSPVKGLGSWISGAAASVSATVTQSIGSRPGLERQRSDSQAASIRTISGGIQRRDSLRNGTAAPATPISATKSIPTASSLRPALQAAPAPSFGGAAKATFTSLFSRPSPSPAPQPSSFNPEDDELCTLDLLSALPPPTEGTSAEQLHKTAMSLLRKFQGGYKTRTEQVQGLKMEAEVRDEEVEGNAVRSKSLKAQLEALSRTVMEKDEVAKEMEGRLREMEQALKEVTEELRQNNAYLREIGPETPLEELDAEEAERRRASRTTEDTESVHGSIFSGMQTTADTPITNTTTTSSASSIRSTTTPRPEQRKSMAASSRLSLLSSEDLEKQPSLSSSKPTITNKCENCHGAASSQAWIALSSVRSENQGLKQKLGQMEESIDGVLTDVKVRLREGL